MKKIMIVFGILGGLFISGSSLADCSGGANADSFQVSGECPSNLGADKMYDCIVERGANESYLVEEVGTADKIRNGSSVTALNQ